MKDKNDVSTTDKQAYKRLHIKYKAYLMAAENTLIGVIDIKMNSRFIILRIVLSRFSEACEKVIRYKQLRIGVFSEFSLSCLAQIILP